MQHEVAQRETVERWTTARLVELVPGTQRKLWLVELVPHLVAMGALVKRGRAWFGKRSEIELALLGRLMPGKSRAGGRP